MNAPVTPARDRYVPTVKGFVPLCEGEELKLRCSILLIRDQAAAGSRHCSWEAAPTLEHVERLGAHYAFAKMPISRLKDLRNQMLRLATSASGLDLFAYLLEHPEAARNDD